MLLSEIRNEIDAALAALGLRRERAVVISGSPGYKRGRWALRVELADGTWVKTRRLESPEAAKESYELRARLDDAFAPAIGCHGRVLVEAWIRGERLDADDERARLGEAGELLARLHDAPHSHGTAFDLERWRADSAVTLAKLRAAERLAPADVRALERLLAEHDPGDIAAAVVHNDFCAENLLVDEAGRLRVIDNEWIDVGAVGFDLSRTRTRWPAANREWLRFRDAYRAARTTDGAEAFAGEPFWRIVVALATARIRWHSNADLAEPVAWLRALAAGERG